MHAASVDPEPGSNSPKELHSLAAATSSEGLTARTFKLLDLCHSSVVKVQTASGARNGARRRRPSIGPEPGRVKRRRNGARSGPRSPLEGAVFEEEEHRRAGDPSLERQLRRARRAHGPDQDDVEDDPDQAGHDDFAKPKDELDDELAHALRSPIARRPWRARMRVTSSAYSRSPPTGIPRAIRVTLPTRPSSRSSMYMAVASPSSVGFVARMISSNGAPSAAAASIRLISSWIFSRSGPIPSIGEMAPCRTW